MMPKMVRDAAGQVIPMFDFGATYVLDGSSASVASVVFDADDKTVVCVTGIDTVYVKRGTNPTATSSDLVIPAGSDKYLRVAAGEKLAVLGGKAGIAVCV